MRNRLILIGVIIISVLVYFFYSNNLHEVNNRVPEIHSGGLKLVAQSEGGKGLNIKEYQKLYNKIDKIHEFYKGFAIVESKEKYGIVNQKGEVIIPPTIYDSMIFDPKGLIRVKLDNNYGYINTKGDVVIPTIYDEYGSLWEDNNLWIRKNGKLGIINDKGDIILPFEYDLKERINEPFFSGSIFRVVKDGKIGIVDIQGHILIPVEFSSLGTFTEGLAPFYTNDGRRGYVDGSGKTVLMMYDFIGNFHNGLARVNKTIGGVTKYGFINQKGEIMLPLEYDKAEDFSGGLAVICKEAKCGLINQSGSIVLSPEYDSIEDNKIIKKSGKFGLIDENGKIVLEPKFESILSLNNSEGLMLIRLQGKEGLINSSGIFLIQPEYTRLENFSTGFLLAEKGFFIFGVVNYSGEVIIPIKYALLKKMSNELIYAQLEATSGQRLASVMNFSGNTIIPPVYNGIDLIKVYKIGENFSDTIFQVRKSSKYGLINYGNHIVLPIEYDYISPLQDDDIVIVEKGGKYGIASIYGSLIADTNYDYIGNFYEGFAEFKKGSEWGVINKKGELAFELN